MDDLTKLSAYAPKEVENTEDSDDQIDMANPKFSNLTKSQILFLQNQHKQALLAAQRPGKKLERLLKKL
jgi:hypothetical protein